MLEPNLDYPSGSRFTRCDLNMAPVHTESKVFDDCKQEYGLFLMNLALVAE